MKTPFKKLRLIVVLVFDVLARAAYAAATFTTFGTDSDGWTVDRGEFGWSPAGGRSDGYLWSTNDALAYATAIAPCKFEGDWSVFDGIGSLKYDHRIFTLGSGSAYTFQPYRVDISGPGGSATWTGTTPIGVTAWVTLTVPIAESAWNVTSGSWSELLSNVTLLQIQIEQVGNDDATVADQDGIDNVFLSASPITSAPPSLSIDHAVQIAWQSSSNFIYQVQWASQIDSNAWFNLAGPTVGNGTTNTVCDKTGGREPRFYRVMSLP